MQAGSVVALSAQSLRRAAVRQLACAPVLQEKHTLSLPILDFSAIRGACDVELVQSWGKAFEEHGFVLLRGIPQEVLQAVADLEARAREFFSGQSVEQKRQFQLSKHYRAGYGSPGQIAVSHGSTIRKRNSDAVETFSLPSLSSEIEMVADAVIPSPLFPEKTGGKCRSYEDSGALRAAFVRYYKLAQQQLMLPSLELTRKYFQLEDTYFRSPSGGFYAGTASGTVLNAFGRVTTNHYLPRWQDNQLEYGEHTDTSMFTFVRRSGPNGLQFSRRPHCSTGTDPWDDDGAWVDIPYDPDIFVVNSGDTMERMTNGRWKAVLHRVTGAPRELGMEVHDRHEKQQIGTEKQPLTVGFFVQPCHEHALTPLPSPLIEQQVRAEYFPVLTAAGLREAKVGNMRKPDEGTGN